MKAGHRKRVPLVHLEMVREKTVFYGKRNSGKRSITDVEEAAEFAASFYHHDDREKIYVCVLNMEMEPVNVSLVAVGGIAACVFPIPEIFKTALLSNCRNILLWHNHPSGSAQPSSESL